MATKTEKYELRKKEDNDFYNIDDFNDNMDKIETALTEFDDSGSVDGITSFTDMLKNLVTGNKLAVTLRNLKAGLQFVLHTGSIVNNCVTDNAKLPLSAAQGKALQDAIAKLNGDLPSNVRFYSLKTTPNTWETDLLAFVKSLPTCTFIIAMDAGWAARVDGMVTKGGNWGTMLMMGYNGAIQKSGANGDGVWSAWGNL